MNTYKFLGTIIYFDKKEIVVIPPKDYLLSVFPREKLKNKNLKIGGEVFSTATSEGYNMSYMFNKLKPGEEATLEELRSQYLEFHKKE